MRRALIVDDSASYRNLTKETMEKCGYEIVGEANDGKTAIKMYEMLKPDVVTIDISKPDFGGIEVLRMIKLMDSNARIIVLSSVGQEKLAKEAQMAGAVAFIVKPFG